MGLVKTLGIPMFILSFLCLENSELLQYIVAGMFGVVSRLGFKGILEEISNINYATMGEDPTNGSSPSYGVARGSGDSDLPQGQDKGSSESGTEMADESSSESDTERVDRDTAAPGESSSQGSTTAGAAAAPGESSSQGNTQGSSAEGNIPSQNRVRGSYASERLARSFSRQVDRYHEEIKSLKSKMNNIKDEKVLAEMEEELARIMEDMSLAGSTARDYIASSKSIVDGRNASSSSSTSATVRKIGEVESEGEEERREEPSTKKRK